MQKPCECCGDDFQAQRSTARFCSPRCRNAALKAVKSGKPASSAVKRSKVLPGDISTVDSTRAAIVAAGRESHYLAAAALKCAARIDESTAVMGFAGLLKQLEATMSSVLAGVEVAADPIDELRARRALKLSG